MILAENISKQFNGFTAVKDVSFRVEEGETLVLLGTSGCGKTTTLKMLNRLTEPSSGNIFINKENTRNIEPALLRRQIGYVMQNTGLFPHYTVAENIAVVPRLLKWSNEKITTRINVLLEKLKLPAVDFLHKYPHELSGGQQQRIGLARALAADPPVLLMDEPFGALDPITRMDIVKEFKNLDELKNKTIVMVTHDVQEAFELGNKICVMDRGKVMQMGNAVDLLFHPANDFVKDFLHHRGFQLELNTIKIIDGWQQLNDTSATEFSLKSNNSLWDALQLLSSQNNMEVTVHDDSTNMYKNIGFKHIQSIIQTVKNSRSINNE